MKITYLSQASVLGGAERALLDFLASLRASKSDWPLHVILPDEGPLAGHVHDLGVPTSVVTLPRSIARLGDARLGG